MKFSYFDFSFISTIPETDKDRLFKINSFAGVYVARCPHTFSK